MSRPLVMVCVAVTVLSAGCIPQPSTAPNRTWNVAPRELHRSYVAGDDMRWTDQTVRVLLAAGAYEVGPRSVHWSGGRPTDGPDVVFDCHNPPPDNSKPLALTGVVKGKIGDDEDRSSGLKWHVRVEFVVVTAR